MRFRYKVKSFLINQWLSNHLQMVLKYHVERYSSKSSQSRYNRSYYEKSLVHFVFMDCHDDSKEDTLSEVSTKSLRNTSSVVYLKQHSALLLVSVIDIPIQETNSMRNENLEACIFTFMKLHIHKNFYRINLKSFLDSGVLFKTNVMKVASIIYNIN